MSNERVRWFTAQENVEQDAVNQVYATASMPFVHGLAVMPDVHFGKGSTVGTVVATKGAVMPACVGVDIGCGMIAARTNLKPEDIANFLPQLREDIERRIPLGIGPYGMNSRILPSAEPRIEYLERLSTEFWEDINHMNNRGADWRRQVGSLGGGNHFIEICSGDNIHWCYTCAGPPVVWIILHSGSRGVGNRTGTHWMGVARKLPKHYMYGVDLPNPDLAALIEGTPEYDAYMKELFWCQEFARLNREEMLDRVLAGLFYTLGREIHVFDRVNCHHNYVSKETHDGEELLVTRKGAIRADIGDRGLVPGSMGTRSYIVSGLGNRSSFNSAPHGAGRRMSRGQARRTFNLETVTAEMQAQGIEARMRMAILDEAPGAYKDIGAVMEDAKTLVQPTEVLKQMISIKGD